MGRFLTPSKITLLALAQVYCKGLIPLSGTANVLNILVSRILLDPKASDELLQQQSNDTILELERALAGQQSIVPGRTVWDLLLKELWAIDCADALEWFVSDLLQHLGKTRDELLRERDEGHPPQPAGKIVRTSPLGLFIRRCSLEWNRLQFQDSSALWMDLVAYRLPSKGAYMRKNPQVFKNAFDSNLAELEIDPSHPLASIIFRPMLDNVEAQQKHASTYDLEKLMEFQISEMQSIGGRLPESMKTSLKQIAEMGTSASKLSHYLHFLDSWRAGDFTSAFDQLHRYFDYAMHSRDRIYYQYALLNLAILQADFGCHEEAIPAMQEAIATARENRDAVCLNYCMSWLYHFGRAFPAQMQAVRETGVLGNESEGLNFLKSRAKESQMWSLLSTTLISEARINLLHGESLALCFENIVKASHINIIKEIPNSNGPGLILKSVLFSRIGQTSEALSCSDRFMLCHAEDAPLEDMLKCTLRQASLFAQMGRLTESRNTMSNVPESILQVLKHKIHYTTFSLILRARRLLHRSNLDAAKQIISQLVAQQPHPDIDITTQVSLLQIDLHIRRREFAQALSQINILAEKVPTENNDIVLQAKLMTLKANLLAKSDKAHQGFSLVLRAIDLTYTARTMPALWEACLALANILIESYEFVAAKELLTAILPQIHECLDCELTGRCYMLLADCFVGLAGLEGAKPPGQEKEKLTVRQKQEGLMGKAADMLEKAGVQFRQIEELESQLEVLAKMGKIFVWRGDVSLANEIGEKYLALKREYAEEV